jgi:hypothetical protein
MGPTVTRRRRPAAEHLPMLESQPADKVRIGKSHVWDQLDYKAESRHVWEFQALYKTFFVKQPSVWNQRKFRLLARS